MTDTQTPDMTPRLPHDPPAGSLEPGIAAQNIFDQFRFDEEAAAQQAVLDAITPQHLANLRESRRPTPTPTERVLYREGVVRKAGRMATRAAEYLLSSDAGFSAK